MFPQKPSLSGQVSSYRLVGASGGAITKPSLPILPVRSQYAPKKGLGKRQRMPERCCDVDDDEACQRQSQQPMGRIPERFGDFRDRHRQVRDDDSPEQDRRNCQHRSRNECPSAERQSQHQPVKSAMDERSPATKGSGKARGKWRRPVCQSPDSAQRRQRQQQKSYRLMPLDEFECAPLILQSRHQQAKAKLSRQQHGHRPMQADRHPSVS